MDHFEKPPVMPLFDGIDHFLTPNPFVARHITQVNSHRVDNALEVFEYTHDWLSESLYEPNNFKSYRSEITTFLYWLFEVEQEDVRRLRRSGLSRYMNWCMNPSVSLITTSPKAQFKNDKLSDSRIPNSEWRPFVATKGQRYTLKESALTTKLAILSTYFNYLIDEEYSESNPAIALMRSGKFKETKQATQATENDETIKSLSDLQWSYVYQSALDMAKEDPDIHERTLFIMSIMYSCYLRISEISNTFSFSPIMSQFRRDAKTGTWGYYIPKSKGKKSRTVALSQQAIDALIRYRRHLAQALKLDLPDLPLPDESTPILWRIKKASRGDKAGVLEANIGERQLREIIESVFKRAADDLMSDGLTIDAAEVRLMTPHSLRHTGISHDINLFNRPVTHVKSDAGHDSIDTTSRYEHTTKQERHESAFNKPLDSLRWGNKKAPQAS